jgi:hypothetical protein
MSKLASLHLPTERAFINNFFFIKAQLTHCPVALDLLLQLLALDYNPSPIGRQDLRGTRANYPSILSARLDLYQCILFDKRPMPAAFVCEMRLALAVKWYELGKPC